MRVEEIIAALERALELEPPASRSPGGDVTIGREAIAEADRVDVDAWVFSVGGRIDFPAAPAGAVRAQSDRPADVRHLGPSYYVVPPNALKLSD